MRIGIDEPKIEKIILFGSRAVGDYTDRSDIDLAFSIPNMTSKEWTAFTFYLEDELDTLLSLDMIHLEEAPSDLREEILTNGVIIHQQQANTSSK